MSENKSGSLVAGVVLGAAIGAGLTFLFGTKKGKEIRNKVRDQYPEVFDKIDEVLEGVEDRYEDVVDEVENIKEDVAEMTEDTKDAVSEKVADLSEVVKDLGKKLQVVSSHRFKKSGRKLKL